jgi:hypothetical protein
MPRTEAELQEMVKHVQYEIDEFRRSFDALAQMGDKRPPEWNRTVESVLLHFRILRGFFLHEEYSDEDDVFAHHYVATTWPYERTLLKDLSNIFGKTKAPLDKRLAHLTLERRSDYPWRELNEMRDELERMVEEFRIALPEARAAWFPRLKRPTVRMFLGAADNSTLTGGTAQVLSISPVRTEELLRPVNLRWPREKK